MDCRRFDSETERERGEINIRKRMPMNGNVSD